MILFTLGMVLGCFSTYAWLKHFPITQVTPDTVFSTLAKNIPESAIVLFDQKLHILVAEGPLFTKHGLVPSLLQGKALTQTFPEQIDNTRKYGPLILAGHTYHMDMAFQGYQYHVIGFPIPSPTGVPTVQRGLVIVTDVSVTRHRDNQASLQNKDLERSNRDLEQFADVASHELKAPLRRVSSFIELVQMEKLPGLSPEGHEYLEQINVGVGEMRAVVDALLTYSRVKLTENRMQQVDLNNVLSRVQEGLSPRIEETGAKVTVVGKLPVISGDPELLRLLFKNLVWNAIKFTAAHKIRPLVTVTSEATNSTEHGAGWKISVTDNGMGIPDEQKDQLFLMFRRTMPEVEGQGIGLALCKKIMGIHRGKIMVSDAAPDPTTGNTGAVFSVLFPASTTGFKLI